MTATIALTIPQPSTLNERALWIRRAAYLVVDIEDVNILARVVVGEFHGDDVLGDVRDAPSTGIDSVVNVKLYCKIRSSWCPVIRFGWLRRCV